MDICLLLWGSGQTSATSVQKLAAAALLDGASHPELGLVASIGSWGANPNHCHRDLLRLARGGREFLSSFSVPVPCLDSKLHPPYTEAVCSLMLPHMTVHSLAKLYPEQFSALMGLADVRTFWSRVRAEDPRLVGNPVLGVDRNRVVPMWLHGDGVEFSTDSLLTFSIGSCLCGQAGMDSSLFVAAWPKSAAASSDKHPAGTWDKLFVIIAWSMTALWEGVHPHVDWEGRPFAVGSQFRQLAGSSIANGWRFLLWQLVGDLEYYANVLKLPHWTRHEFCWWCDCSRVTPGKLWVDFSDNPGWQMLSADTMRQRSPSAHPFFLQIPGCAPALRSALDGMHTVEFGLAARLAGSVFHCWVFEANQPRTAAADRLAVVWRSVRAAYITLNVHERLNNLLLNQFCDAKNPWAHPPVMKCHAGELRHLIPALALVARQRSRGAARDEHICKALECLATFYMVCDEQDMFMEQAAWETAFEMMKQCLQHYAWLHRLENSVRFHLVPKLHFCYHLAWFCRWQNPRSFWTYKNEDWVGKMAKMAHSCSHGTRAVRLSASLVQKYITCLHIRLTRCVFDD